MPTEILIVSGEASSDQIAADLVSELKLKKKDLHFFGVGGAHLRAQGAEILVEGTKLSIIGLSQVLIQLREIFSIRDGLVNEAKKRKPALAILLDLPDFNLSLAKKLKALGIPVVYYISPQLWAWRKNRIFKIKKIVDHMLVLFPFEKELYERHQIPVTFVGHPLTRKVLWKESVRSQSEVSSSPRVGLFPGSRHSEIRNHKELLLKLVRSLKKKYPSIEFKLAKTSHISEAELFEFKACGVVLESQVETVFGWTDISVLASGTITLENALAGIPSLLFYKVSAFNNLIFKYYVRYFGHLGLPNILLKKEVMKEFFQKNATADNLENEIIYLIENQTARQQMRSQFFEIRKLLNSEDPSQKAAEVVLSKL